MALWVRNTTAGPFTISDLGITVPLAGEVDLNASVLFEDLLKSTDLTAAVAGGSLDCIDGAGGAVITLDVPNVELVKNTLWHATGSGILDGAVLTLTGGVGFSVAAGAALIKDSDGIVHDVHWGAPLVGTTLFAGANYIGVDHAGAIAISASFPGNEIAKVGYIRTNATNASVLGFSSVANLVESFPTLVHQFARLGIGGLCSSGCITSEQGGSPLSLNINGGTFFAQLNKIVTGDQTTFTKLHKTSDLDWVVVAANPNIVDVLQWNDITKASGAALIAMTPGFWKKDLIVLIPAGTVYYIYGQAEYASEALALAAPLPATPSGMIDDGAVMSAHITLLKSDASIATRIYDIRPVMSRVFGYGIAGGSGIAVLHSALLGLGADDHGQYHNDSRALTWLGTRSTTDLPEGTNLYFTDGLVTANANVAAATSHIARTDNPHAVTKSQVTLGSVTNDAQLKRAAGDFAAFTVKGSPIAADVILLEDSADATNKKYATLGTLPTNVHATTHKPGAADPLDLRQLTYFIDEGPAEGFASGSYREVTGGVFPTAVKWYDSAGPGKKKIVEILITRNAQQVPTVVVWKSYDAAEALLKTVTDTISYTGVAETSRTRTIA